MSRPQVFGSPGPRWEHVLKGLKKKGKTIFYHPLHGGKWSLLSDTVAIVAKRPNQGHGLTEALIESNANYLVLAKPLMKKSFKLLKK